MYLGNLFLKDYKIFSQSVFYEKNNLIKNKTKILIKILIKFLTLYEQ